MKRTMRWTVVVLGFLCAVPTAATAEEPQQTLADFEEALESLQRYRANRQYTRGLQKLKALLAAHDQRPYVRAYRAELEDLAERFAFGTKHEAPKPVSVTKGKLDQYDAATGRIKLRWTKDDHAMTRRPTGSWLFPPIVSGPFTIEIKGKRYPDDGVQIIFSGLRESEEEVRESKHVVLHTRSTPKLYFKRDSNREKTVGGKGMAPAAGEKYRVELKISKTQIRVRVNGKSSITTKWKGDIEGWLYAFCDAWDEVTFNGVIEPAWIQSKLDQQVQKQLQEFRKRYRPQSVLGRWLYKEVDEDTYESASSFPERLSGKYGKQFDRYEKHMAKSASAYAINAVEDMREDGAPHSVCDYLTARVHREAGRYAKCLEFLDRCLENAPDFLLGILYRARTLTRLGQDDEALAACELAVKKHPKVPLAYEISAETCLYMSRRKDARSFAARAASNGIFTKRLDDVGKTLVRALHGPNWVRTYEHKSTNYHVISDIDAKSCRQAARLLERSLTAYRVQLHWTKRTPGKRFKVCLFSGQEGFAEYAGSLRGGLRPPKWAAGLYSPSLKQLLIWNLPIKDRMLKTIRHEGFHQYLDSLMSFAPVWFNEGLAEYHENGELKHGRLKFGIPNHAHARLLQEKGIVPLHEFLFQPRAKFYGDPSLSYAQSWAFMHMLKNGPKEQRKLFEDLMKDLQSQPASQVIERLFTPMVVEKLDKQLREYISGLPTG